ncbi:MAG: autotransporter assembly complex family protein, partial [Mesorhizobium sp.]|nr:autotransporter assembly complex family protein [Mesorhizobium sp.]
MLYGVAHVSRVGAVARGALHAPLAACVLVFCMCFAAGPAAAFELFGVRLWGTDEKGFEDVADPVRYTVTFDFEGTDEAIRDDILAASALEEDSERPVSGSLGVLAKARNERELLVAALYQEARYDGVVDILIDGQPLDSLEPDAQFDTSKAVPITVSVRAGPAFTLGQVTVAGDAGGLAPAEYGLMPGGDAGSDTILAAENRMLRALKDEGRPLARVATREVIANHDTDTLDVMLAFEAGPIAPFGDTQVEGTETVDRDFTAYMADIERGRTYSPEEIEDARQRLLALGVFDSVTVKERDALAADGSIPVDITVSERKHRFFGVGATLSSTDGAGIEGYWGHRNLFGRAEKLRIEGSISRIGDANTVGNLDYNAALLFEKPGLIGPASKFTFDIKATSDHPDAYDRFLFSTGVGLAYDFTKRQTLTGQLRVEYSDISDAFNPAGKRYLLVSTPIQYVYDARDNKLNPTKGYRFLAFAEPTYDLNSGAAFVKFKGEASAYQSLAKDGRIVLAGRVAAGTIAGGNLNDIPADRKFYVGGGGSVRGYSYQGLGPKIPDPRNPGEFAPIGGRSFAEASAEIRVQETDSFG